MEKEMEKKEAESLSGVFVPDLSDVQEFGRSGREAIYLHYHKAKCLIEGALGVVTDSDCANCMAAKDLLEAFLETMEKAEDAFDGADALHPTITIDELKEMIGTAGSADVSGIRDRDGQLTLKRFRLEGKPVAVPVHTGNGKKSKKAA